MSVIDKFLDCGTINIFGVIVTTISCILAVIFYLKSKKAKKPYYEMTSFNLVNSELKQIEGIEIKFNNSTIKNLTATKFVFWNEGKDTIDKNDLPELAPLTIRAKDTNTQLYTVEVVSMSEPSNQIRVNQVKFSCINPEDENIRQLNEPDEFRVEFDYLDQYQKGELKILHSGTSNDDLIITGKIKGAGDFKNAALVQQKKNIWKLIGFMVVITFCMSYIMFYDSTIVVEIIFGVIIGTFTLIIVVETSGVKHLVKKRI